jgi:uncharacterized membrane protein HdeD (DUF308 family)
MSSLFEQAQKNVGSQLKSVRWALGLSGLAWVALGAVIIIWPGISLFSLVIVFGAFALVRGVIGLVGAISSPIKQGRGWLVVSSLAGIAVGVLVFLRTDMSALALLYVIGAYAIALGVITIGGAFWLPIKNGGDRVLLTVTGFVSILFGVVMFAKPGAGALALLALIAAYAIIFGVIELTVAIGGESLVKWSVRHSFAPSNKPQTQPSH